MKRNLLVFDIDDTLTKSEDQHQTAYVSAMKQFGIKNINQDWKTYDHYTDSYILKVNYENNLTDKFDLSFINEFEVVMANELLKLQPTAEIKGATSMMDFIKHKSDYAICFATGSLLQPALLKLNHAGIQYELPIVMGSNSTFERESIIKNAIEAAKKHYQVNSFNHIISVGDGLWDVKAAQNLGLHFIGIGSKNHQNFMAQKVKSYIHDWTSFDLERVEKELNIQHN
ncbi:MAG: HAD hydrolase-like protein [Chitinophagales bacterium]